MESVVEHAGIPDRSDALRKGFRLGEWTVRPIEGMIDGELGERHLQPKSMDVLLCLACSASEIVERDELIEHVWGHTAVTDEPLTRCIHEIRRELCDTCDKPIYIQTIPKRGYRLIAPVEALDADPTGRFPVLTDTPSGAPLSARKLLQQLFHRPVVRVGIVYAIVAWGLGRVAGYAYDAFGLGASWFAWLLPALMTLLLIGFPIAVFVAWMREVGGAAAPAAPSYARIRHLLWSRQGINVIATATLLAVLAGMAQDLRTSDVVVPVAAKTRSIAVLPFATVGGTDADAWLGEGLAEDLLNLFGEVSGLEVAPRAASFRKRFPATDVVDVGHALNVHFVLKGNVERLADQLRVNVRLIDAQTRHRLWGAVYERPARDWFALQAEITQQVVAALAPGGEGRPWATLRVVERPVVAVAPTSSMDAYDYYLKARSFLQGPESQEALDVAAENFAKAIQLDSGFARAYAGLCATLVRQLQLNPAARFAVPADDVCAQGVTLHPESIDTRMAHADLYRVSGRTRQAIADYRWVIERKPQTVEAYVGLAGAFADLGNFDRAEQGYRRAIDLRPDYVPAYRDFGSFLLARGRFAEALDQGRHMIRLYPDSVAGYTILGDASFSSGRFTAAIAAYREVIVRQAQAPVYAKLGASLYYLGRYRDAVRLYQRAADLAPRDHRVWADIGDAYSQIAGGRQQAEDAFNIARELIEEELELVGDDPVNRMRLAYYCAALGDQTCAWNHSAEAVEMAPELPSVHYLDALVNLRLEQEAAAIAAVERAIQLGYPRALLLVDPQLAKVRSSPRLSAMFFPQQTLARNAARPARSAPIIR